MNSITYTWNWVWAGNSKDKPRNVRVNTCFSPSYTPGWVAPKDWSICSIVGDTSGQLNNTSLKIVKSKIWLFWNLLKTRISIAIQNMMNDKPSYQYLSFKDVKSWTSITFNRWLIGSKISLMPSNVRFMTRSTVNGSWNVESKLWIWWWTINTFC